jgi:tight adherence protein B
MMAILTSTELWVGLAALVMGVMLVSTGRAEKKRQHERLQRITRKTPRMAAATAQSLRRKDPNEGSKLGKALANFSSIEKLRERLEIAGLATTPKQFLTRCLVIWLLVTLLMIILGKPPLLALLLGILAGLGVPRMLLRRKIRKRQLLFLKLFPEAIDLIVRGLRAGLPVAESFIVVSKEIRPPVGDLFFTISQQTGLGVPMEKALADAAERLDLTEFNFFVTTIILQRETGGNLGEILNNLAEVLRGRQMMKLKIGALSSEARASAYIVGSLPFFVFGMLSLISPTYLDPLYDDYRGNMCMAVASGMMFFGGFIMKKMTQLEI